MKVVNKSFEELKTKIAKSLREVLLSESKTPDGEKSTPCDVFVSYNHLRPVEDEENTAQATVGYTVHWCKERRHAVSIKFKYDNKGKFLRDTMVYV